MNPGDTDIVQMLGAVAHHAGRQERFFRYRNVAGPGGNHEDRSFSGNFLDALDGDGARQLLKLSVTRFFSARAFHGCKNLLVRAGHQDVVPRVFFAHHGAHNFRHLLRRFPFAQNDFGKTLPQRAVMIHLGKAEIFKRQMLQALDGFVRGKLAGFHGFQNFQQFKLIHIPEPR